MTTDEHLRKAAVAIIYHIYYNSQKPEDLFKNDLDWDAMTPKQQHTAGAMAATDEILVFLIDYLKHTTPLTVFTPEMAEEIRYIIDRHAPAPDTAAERDRLRAEKAELVGILMAVKNCQYPYSGKKVGLCSGCRSRIRTAIAKHKGKG